MRSFVVCALVFAIGAVSAQAGAVKTHPFIQDLQYSCDLEGLITQAKNIIADSIAAAMDVRDDFAGVSTGVIGCVEHHLADFEAMYTCGKAVVEKDFSSARNTIEQYLSDLTSSINKIKAMLNKCRKL